MARKDTRDDQYVSAARLAGIVTLTLLIAITAIADIAGRLYIDPQFHVSEVIFASLLAAWTTLLGIESVSIVRGARKNDEDE